MTPTLRRSRTLAAALAGLLVSTGVASGAWAERSASDTELLLEQKVDPDLLEEIDDSGESELWLRFAGDPDWSGAAAADDKEAKGRAAVEAAREFAEASQAEAVEELEAAGADYETFWGSSTVKVDGDADLLEDLVALDEVEEVVEPSEYHYIEPVGTEDRPDHLSPGADGAEAQQDDPLWNLEQVGAPEAWDEGVDGEGIVVASIDSGVQYDHPALVDRYRGNNGDGTFTHDYNFFDAAGECGRDPCDLFGHGTHTMGTMVGDDGDGNRIGVAPGATWIAASAGQAPTSETFLAAGEWIAAPTDRRGLNPDPAMAPHVVNNSWGGPAEDPFFADIVDLWHAAGIIPVFAAGNAGDQGCETVGSPGDYGDVITVGATDIDGNIAPFSSKGPTADGLVKPDIAAPGDGVLSSVPGDGYEENRGTSMAAPHVAGTVALMMSSSPKLEGDYWKVYKYLTRNAVAEDDTSCGGTAKLNNVYGHGRLDAYEAALDPPEGRFGSLDGEVVDEDGRPVAGARLTLDGWGVDRVAATDSDGAFDIGRIPAGWYRVTAERFTYETATGWVKVKRRADAEFSARLTRVPVETVEGVVADGSGHGWPLSAEIGTSGGEAYAETDPFTGEFSLEVPVEGDWELDVRAFDRGYGGVSVGADESDLIEIPFLEEECTAPGYGSEVLDERFGASERPEGWEVVNRGEAEGWVFDAPFGYGNSTTGTGGFAQANSDAAGPEALVDTDMITAPFDLTEADDPTLAFRHLFADYEFGGEADIAVSADGGGTWEQVWHTDAELIGGLEEIDLSAWADEEAVQLRFHYTDNDTWAFVWQVDDVRIGCDLLGGGLVRGTVADQDGEPVEGATVLDPATGNGAVTDGRGEYVLFTDAGAATLEASAEAFGSGSSELEVVADAVVGADFRLTPAE
ncbi:S8 family serine peptidase [Glycomyces xiaoerkulensis]|uniref:S8 family serine peptidase n=1 Tax=Glycomyces xiaoerkulensis TaxID=2038139 RepID=UPI000C261881|nr:S8 family serine peptidase [Glycomyces xiaoerkulensis]